MEAIKILKFEGIEENVQFKRVNIHYDKIRGRLNIHQYIVQNGSIDQVIQMKLILKTLNRKKATINQIDIIKSREDSSYYYRFKADSDS
jgi:hypothetical protein